MNIARFDVISCNGQVLTRFLTLDIMIRQMIMVLPPSTYTVLAILVEEANEASSDIIDLPHRAAELRQ